MAMIPNYRLQTLLELRERKKETAEQELAKALQALKKAQDRLEEMQEELKRMIAEREERRRVYLERAMHGSMDAAGAININQYMERLKELEKIQEEAIVGQKAVVEQKKLDVKDARENLIHANQALKTLQNHKEKWLQEILKERAAREEEVLDDLAQSLFFRKLDNKD